MTTAEGTPVGTEHQIVEAFSLGGTLATIGTDVKHLVTGVHKLELALQGAVDDVGTLKTNDARQDEQLKTLFAWKREVETAPAPEYATKADFNELRAEVSNSRLSWPKLLAGAGTLIAGAALLLGYANARGAFSGS